MLIVWIAARAVGAVLGAWVGAHLLTLAAWYVAKWRQAATA